MIDPNKPKKNPNDDELGYKLFSQDFARNIVKMTPEDGFVIGLTGPWGSGKSTALSFTECYLTDKKDELSLNDGEIPLILHFNPWMFSGQTDIVVQFFSQLKEEFPKSGNYDILSRIHPEILNNLNIIFTKLTELAIATGYSDPIVQKIVLSTKVASDAKKTIGDFISRKENSSKNVLLLKKEVETHLWNIDFKILIIVDDIDRLTPEEIRQLFRGIKSLADFPNVIYLLAYDESIVIEALKDLFSYDSNQDQNLEKNSKFARNYLEKIVQFSIPLPTPEKWSLSHYFEAELSMIFEGTDENYFERKHWVQSYNNGVSFFLTNPRRVKNLTNSLKFLYPSVKNEVNFVDFVLLDSIRIFQPNIYSIIRENPRYFLFEPVKESWAGGIKNEIYVAFHEKWMNELSQDEKIPVERIVFNLFPIVASRFGQKIGLANEIIIYNESHSLNKGRICSDEDTFSRFFRYTLQPSDISLKDLKFELTSQTDPQYYVKKFESLIKQETDNGWTKASEYLEKLNDYLDETTPKETISAILIAFFEVADQLMLVKDERPKALGYRKNDHYIMDITELGLSILPENERMQLLNREIHRSKSISYVSLLILELGTLSGKFNEYRKYLWRGKIVNDLQYQELERLYLYNLQNCAKKDFEILQKPHLDEILLVWRELSLHSEKDDGFINVSDYITKFIQNKPAIITTIANVMERRYSGGLNVFSLNPDISSEQFIKIINDELNLEILTISVGDTNCVKEFLNKRD